MKHGRSGCKNSAPVSEMIGVLYRVLGILPNERRGYPKHEIQPELQEQIFFQKGGRGRNGQGTLRAEFEGLPQRLKRWRPSGIKNQGRTHPDRDIGRYPESGYEGVIFF